MMRNKWLQRLLFSLVVPALTAYAVVLLTGNKGQAMFEGSGGVPSGLMRQAALKDMPTGFVKASAVATPAVVFIKTVSTVQYNSGFGWFWDFDPFGSRGQVSASGSGVIMSKDGYIVTNNHVIQGANEITVVLSQRKREYKAKLVGADPSTDLALLKIEAETELPFVTFSNSDNLQIGDWVVAVGNPFNLTSTVTAGIVSAKGRNINLLNNQFPIESFIQTDAAINPGNSGGALVDLEGRLVGINTAIASNTGSYAGYGFAIPSNIVQKIVKDFVAFGEVKRAFPGMEVVDLTANQASNLSLDGNGVVVQSMVDDGPAVKAGLKQGDIILGFDGKKLESKATYDELLAYRRPSDKIKLKVLRGGNEFEAELTLISKDDNKALIMKGAVNSAELGADFQPLSEKDLSKYGITEGIRLLNIKRGVIAQMGLPEGFIITKYNGKGYKDAQELISAIESSRGRVKIEGITKEGAKQTLQFYTY